MWEYGQPQMAAGSMLDDFVDLLDGQSSMRDAIIAAALPRARVGSAGGQLAPWPLTRWGLAGWFIYLVEPDSLNALVAYGDSTNCAAGGGNYIASREPLDIAPAG